MAPTIAQLLQSLRATMDEVIIPALPANAGFAKEQAGLMLGTLDWLADVHAHAYHYALIENAEYRELVAELVRSPGIERDAAEAAHNLLAQPRPAPPAETMPSDVVAAQNVELKSMMERLFELLVDTENAERVRALVLRSALRQGEREQAWFRMTGFPREAGQIGEVLASMSSSVVNHNGEREQ